MTKKSSPELSKAEEPEAPATPDAAADGAPSEPAFGDFTYVEAPSPWKVLSRIDVSAQIEKKNGLSYLSWAWAWGVLREHYPDCYFIKHATDAGVPYFIDPFGYAYVKVTVGLDATGRPGWEGQVVTETFPVLDHRNKPIQGPNSFDVNNALQRCLTKCIGYLGLGHYIYAGEDLPAFQNEYPDESADPPSTPPKNANSVTSGQAPITGLTQQANPAPVGAFMAPPASETTPMVKPGGEIVGIAADETLARTIENLLPICLTVDDLNKFWTENAQARAVLKTRSPHLLESVKAAFAKRKAELPSTPASS